MSELAEHPFWEKKNEGFGVYSSASDFLHPELSRPDLGAAMTETHYFGFNVPEEGIHGHSTIWHHPNLKTVSGGTYVWKGIKEDNMECELFDFVTFMSDECLNNDLWDYRFDNSYHVQTLEPLKRHRLRYDDPVRQNSFDIHYEAIMPPMMLSSGLHFEQAMKTTGSVTLRGKTYEIDAYNVRDRSWGQRRTEEHKNFMPMAWMTGVIDESFVFGSTIWDTPEISDDAYPGLQIPGGKNLMHAWIREDGELIAVTAARKKTQRNRRTLFPEVIDMELTDSKGTRHALTGTVIAAAPWRVWHNFNCIICLVRWEYKGKVFYGDLQECHWCDFVRLARAAKRFQL